VCGPVVHNNNRYRDVARTEEILAQVVPFALPPVAAGQALDCLDIVQGEPIAFFEFECLPCFHGFY